MNIEFDVNLYCLPQSRKLIAVSLRRVKPTLFCISFFVIALDK